MLLQSKTDARTCSRRSRAAVSQQGNLVTGVVAKAVCCLSHDNPPLYSKDMGLDTVRRCVSLIRGSPVSSSNRLCVFSSKSTRWILVLHLCQFFLHLRCVFGRTRHTEKGQAQHDGNNAPWVWQTPSVVRKYLFRTHGRKRGGAFRVFAVSEV